MAEPFLSEIRLFSFGFAPKGWALCNGQLLPINQNQALFSLLGTTYGGDGRTTFGLPNLQGRVPMHMGNGHTLGERAGTDTVTVSMSQMPAHVHIASASTANGDVPTPTPNMLGSFNNGYRALSNPIAIQPSTVSTVGGSQAHENRQPFLAVTYAIALQGIFPSQT